MKVTRPSPPVDALLAEAAHPPVTGRVRALLSPHAGYAYSGAVAACAFATLDRAAFETVVLIGPSHVDAFDFTSVYEGDAYRTPLGTLEVDVEAARRVARQAPSIRLSDRGHTLRGRERGEHGIEVLLPFLQRVCGPARIVPVVMGAQDWESSSALGHALAHTVDLERTLLVASSDLSHFYAYDRAVELDAAFCNALAALDAARLWEAVRSGRCEACGAGPVIAILVAAESWPERSCRVLARRNSGDVTGDRTSVVGYASAIVTTPDR